MAKIFRVMAQILCLVLVGVPLVIGQYQHFLDSLRLTELYENTEESTPTLYLRNGDSEFVSLPLETPVNFYSEKYDQIFINTNGLLTFNIEFPDYINQPFPLEYPSIAPFYANVDTSGANASTTVSLFQSGNPEHLKKASELVSYSFTEEPDFEAESLIVATWRNVGYYDSKTDLLNTFQAAVIYNEEKTFVQFIYPASGLNWIQGETGPLGLPDIRAQAGFVAEDGRFYNLDGSGTDNVRYVNENSNVGVPGVWLFRVGPLDYSDNVQSPDTTETSTDKPEVYHTCAEGSHKRCHSNANCHDKAEGFCCACKDGFYGNGHVCIKNDFPIRVTGSLAGEINGQPIDERSKLQSYIMMVDARSYTAINPVSAELGSQLRLVLPIVSTIGWLFAKPKNGALNGYQLTGGEFSHTSRLSFDSGETLIVNQTFEGLNYWDQLSVQIDIFGDVPQVISAAKFHMADYIDEYKFVSPGELSSFHAHQMEVPSENRVINFKLEQHIYFERCLLDSEVDPTGSSVLQKVSKIVLDYFERDQALRTSILTKIGVNKESNVCTDGSANCGENAICVPYEDTFRCDCLNGYAPEVTDSGVEVCVDIDECATDTHLCDDNAECVNNQGGFSCICAAGFEASGYKCQRRGGNGTAEGHLEVSTPGYMVTAVGSGYGTTVEGLDRNHTEYTPEDNRWDECNDCSPDADCIAGRCECRDGFSGDGVSCVYNCGLDEAWENGQCMPAVFEEQSIEPTCNFLGDCICPESYEMEQHDQMCHYVGHFEGESKSDELVPCDVDANCHINATCEWYDHEMRHICTCSRGFQGDGYHCVQIDETCAIKPGLCDPHAVCRYNEVVGKSECQCERGYEGDGFRCQLAPECRDDSHCGSNSFCDNGVCQCISGYERDISDTCVPAGRCGGVFCGDNALCKWDAVQGVQYCDCMESYEGNALEGCKSIPTPCNVRNTCGVHATCEPTEDPAKYECQCEAGYQGDGYVCVEQQNCLNNPTMCDLNARCMSTNTGLVCVCNQGFYGNGSICLERQQIDSGFLLISQGVVIVRVPLNGKNVRPISVASMAIGLDKDCVEGRVYWGDISAKKIVSAKYDGTEVRSYITEELESPEGVAIDAISRRVYWTDSVKDTIEVASLDDPTLRTVLVSRNLVNPRGIAVDPYREKLYWSDWDRESPKIEMSDLDGTGREVLLDKSRVNLPNSLVVMEDSGELCFADAGTKKVECVDPYSKQIRTISNELTYPFGLTFTKDHFYWTDWTTKKLESVDAFGNRQKGIQTPFFGSHKMYGMTAIHENCPQIHSPCQINNGGCADSRICLANRKAPSGKSCKCTKLSKMCTVPQLDGQF